MSEGMLTGRCRLPLRVPTRDGDKPIGTVDVDLDLKGLRWDTTRQELYALADLHVDDTDGEA